MDELPRRRLGRGLAALIGDANTDSEPVAKRSGPQRTLPVSFLRANPRNPRQAFDPGDLDELAASVKIRGVVQPILVRPIPEKADQFEIIAGERRWRAAQRVGLHDVPVVIREVSDAEALELAIIENVQRADLNPIEEAQGYQQLIDMYAYTQGQLADVIGRSRPHIANMLRILKLPEPVLAMVREGALTAGHARALITHDDPEAAARLIVEKGASVREAEALATADKPEPRAPKAGKQVKDADTIALEKSLSDTLGLAVVINDKSGQGDLRVHYTSLEQLDDVCRRLKRS